LALRFAELTQIKSAESVFWEDILVLNQDYYVKIDNNIFKMGKTVQILKLIIY